MLCEISGRACKLKLPAPFQLSPKAPPKRTAALRFSKTSAKRLSHLLAGVNFTTAPLFLTLTYPVSYGRPGETPHPPPSPRVAKRQLDDFFNHVLLRLSGQSEALTLIWRVEKQANNSPHFHCLLFGLSNDYYEQSKAFGNKLVGAQRWIFAQQHLQDLWQELIGSESSVRIELKEIASQVGAYLYLVGHSCKANQTWPGENIGRYWGLMGRKHFGRYHYGVKKRELSRRELGWLRDIWESFEAGRVEWLKRRYKGREQVARSWEMGSLKLFPLPVLDALAAYHRRKKGHRNRAALIADLVNTATQKHEEKN